jgi:hypothetical protein
MKKWFIPVGGIAVILVGGFLVLSFYLVKQIEPQLQGLMGPGFTAADIKVKPLYLCVEGIGYEDPQSKDRFLEIEEVRVYPVLLSFLKPPLRIRDVTIHKPSVFLYRTREGVFIGPWTTGRREKGRETTKGKGDRKGESVSLKIDRFRVRKGTLYFKDMKTEGSPAQIKLRDVDLELEDIQYPIVSSHSPIQLTGTVEGSTRDGAMDLKGWIDLQTMDMDTVFEIQGMDLKIFEPYYRKRVTAEIDPGTLHMETKIAIRKRVVDAPGKLELTDLHLKEEGTVFWIPAKTLLDPLKEKGDRIEVRFHVKGNMDDPKFNLQETFFIRITISLLEALGFPIKGPGEAFVSGMIKGEKGMVEELKSMEKKLKKKKERKR